MNWEEENDNPFQTKTPTLLQQWRARQLFYGPGTDNSKKSGYCYARIGEHHCFVEEHLQHLHERAEGSLSLYLLNFKFLKATTAAERE